MAAEPSTLVRTDTEKRQIKSRHATVPATKVKKRGSFIDIVERGPTVTKKTSDFIETSRTRAREIKARQSAAGNPVTLAQAYELLASESGYRTWAAMKSADDAKVASAPRQSVPAAVPSITLADLVNKAQDDFRGMMGDTGYNPASVSSATAYNISRDLSDRELYALLAAEPSLSEVDIYDEESQANFGVPRTALETIRFGVAVTLLEGIDMTFYAGLVEQYGHRPAVLRLRRQQQEARARQVNDRVIVEHGSIVIDGVSYSTSTVTSRW